MFRTLALAATLGALALPAAAQTSSITVKIAGLDAKTAHARIVRAAESACSNVLQDSALIKYYETPDCVQETVSKAEAKYAATDHSYASVQNTGR